MMSPDPSAVFRRLEDGGGALNVETDAHYQANASLHLQGPPWPEASDYVDGPADPTREEGPRNPKPLLHYQLTPS